MKSFLDCIGLKTGFSWICGDIAEKQVQLHGQKRFNKLWFQHSMIQTNSKCHIQNNEYHSRR